MLVTAYQKNTRQTSRKLRLVANTVKGLPLADAVKQLAVIERRATLPILKVVKQALANATHNHGLQVGDLVLDQILITEGPRYRRFRAASRGRAHGVTKRTSHIKVVLRTQEQPEAEKTNKESK
jgi:large subunit ribosomal protein L22